MCRQSGWRSRRIPLTAPSPTDSSYARTEPPPLTPITPRAMRSKRRGHKRWESEGKTRLHLQAPVVGGSREVHPGEALGQQRLWVERHRIDDVSVVGHLALQVQGERRTLVHGAAQAAAQLLQMKRRLPGGVSVARVPNVVGEIVADRPAELVRARLGEDLDAAQAELVILRREGILIELDLTDGFLRWKLAAAESVDEDGAAIR